MKGELFKPIRTLRAVLRFTGMWQDGNQSWTYFILGYLVHFISIELCLIGELICAYKAVNLEDFIETMGLTMTYVSEMLKCWNFFYKLKTIQKTFEILMDLVEFSADDRWKSRDRLKSQILVGFKVFKVFWFSAWTTCIFSSLVPFTSHKLPYKVWFPFDTEKSSFGFWIASSYLIVTSFPVSVIDISLDTLPVFLLTFAIGLTNELSDRLDQIGKNNNSSSNGKNIDELNAKEFKKCIEIHSRICEFVVEIQCNFSKVIMVQGIFSSLILCMGTFSMSTVSDLSVLFRITTLMIPMTLEIFLPCYFGNELSIASSKLSVALFHSNWIVGDKNLRNSVKFFMENTKKNMKLSAFGVFEVNLATFSRICNSAYSLFAILKRVSN